MWVREEHTQRSWIEIVQNILKFEESLTGVKKGYSVHNIDESAQDKGEGWGGLRGLRWSAMPHKIEEWAPRVKLTNNEGADGVGRNEVRRRRRYCTVSEVRKQTNVSRFNATQRGVPKNALSVKVGETFPQHQRPWCTGERQETYTHYLILVLGWERKRGRNSQMVLITKLVNLYKSMQLAKNL